MEASPSIGSRAGRSLPTAGIPGRFGEDRTSDHVTFCALNYHAIVCLTALLTLHWDVFLSTTIMSRQPALTFK